MQEPIILLFLILLANGAPVLGYDLFGNRFASPTDFRIRLADGHRLFGPSKTVRGIILSLLATSVGARLLGYPVLVGVAIAASAMAGDLCSSFVKRRLGRRTGSRALGLDQVPEALFPAMAVAGVFRLSGPDIVVVVTAFVVIELVASRFLFKVHLRKHPY